jgi:hypothetical protein
MWNTAVAAAREEQLLLNHCTIPRVVANGYVDGDMAFAAVSSAAASADDDVVG